MKLSVIIPVHNRAEVVKQAVNSVLEQLDHESELILVDDGSSPAVSHEFNDKRLKIIRLDQNQGASNARNVGVEHANGDWISFLDSDDLWLKGRFNQIKNVIEQNKHNLNSQDLKVWITAVVRKKGGGYLYHCVNVATKTDFYENRFI